MERGRGARLWATDGTEYLDNAAVKNYIQLAKLNLMFRMAVPRRMIGGDDNPNPPSIPTGSSSLFAHTTFRRETDRQQKRQRFTQTTISYANGLMNLALSPRNPQ